MKDYEFMVVFHPDLEMNIDPALDKVKKILEANQAKIINEEVDGKKRLAYSIHNQDFGIYYYFDLQLPPEAPNKISKALNISDEVLRFLIVKADDRKDKLAARRAARAADADSAEADAESTEAETTDAATSADAATNEDNTNQEEA